MFTLLDGVITAILGMIVVFVILMFIEVILLLMGKIMGRSKPAPAVPVTAAPAVAAAPAPAAEDLSETLAVLHSVLSAESGIAADKLEIKSVEERK